jgi:hypothetical protein
MSAMARAASRLATSSLTFWRKCSTPRLAAVERPGFASSTVACAASDEQDDRNDDSDDERDNGDRASVHGTPPGLQQRSRRPYSVSLDRRTSWRPQAFAVAYRMARHVAEVEDVVRDALPRVHGALEEGRRIQSPRATSGIGIRSLVTDTADDAARQTETGSRAGSCSTAQPG